MSREPRIPDPEGLHREFYRRTLAAGRLVLQHCGACGRARHPPRLRCAGCGSDAVQWRPSNGRGELWSWTITHTPFDRGWAGEIPYVTAVVELDDGPRIVGALDRVGRAELAIGLRLVTSIVPMQDRFAFISLRPEGDAGG